MEDLFNSVLPDGKRPDLYLCIFPHLKEFLVIDLREKQAEILLLNTAEVFDQDFFESVEEEFSHALREESDFPFAHLINLPLRMEETIREVVMTAILERLGLHLEENQVPSVIVFVLSGGALATQSERLVEGLKGLLRESSGGLAMEEWERTLSRLVAAEQVALQQVNQQELTDALKGESPDIFTLWEQRN
jgi:hypothetical protein